MEPHVRETKERSCRTGGGGKESMKFVQWVAKVLVLLVAAEA